MKHPNRLLTFKYKEEALCAEFRAYILYKFFESIKLLNQGLSREEIESALFSLFLIERKKMRKHIISTQWMSLEIIEHLQKGKKK